MWKNLSLVPLGVLLGVLLLEGGLQLAALGVQGVTRSQFPVSWMTGDMRVLALGDSNTYGLYLERHEAWPAQLESLWNERVEAPRLEVMNLGFPGTNSSRIVRDLPRLLDAFAPDLVVVMVGVNDYWTAAFDAPLDARQAGPGFVQRHSILYRLFALARRGRDAIEVEKNPDSSLQAGGFHVRYGDEEFEMNFRKGLPGVAGNRDGLKRNLAALLELAERSQTPIHLLNYPGRKRFYGRTNDTIREVVGETGAAFVDVSRHFDSLCDSRECPAWLFKDQHPRAPAQRVVAELVMQHLLGQVAPARAGQAGGSGSDRRYSPAEGEGAS